MFFMNTYQYYGRHMLPLDITVMWCVSLPYEIMTMLLLFCGCFRPFHQSEHSLDSSHMYCRTCQSEGWTCFSLELMLKGVCMFERVCLLLCKWGASSTHYRFGRWEPFLWPLHAERRTFYGCRILFPSSMTFITGKKHQESREWGWLYQSLLFWASEGIICPEFIAREGTHCTTWNAVSLLVSTNINTCMHLCTKTFTYRNGGTDAQSKTCTLVRTYELSDSTPGDLDWFALSVQLHYRFCKTLVSTPDWIYDGSIPRYLRWSKLSPCSVCWESLLCHIGFNAS